MTIAINTVNFANGSFEATIGKVTEKSKPFPNGDQREAFEVSINLASLPVTSLGFALAYGLKQYISDGAAGSEDLAGFKLGIQQRIDKLLSGDFTREASAGGFKADTPESLAIKLAAGVLRAKAKAAGIKADPKALAEAAKKLAAANPKYLAQATAEIAAKAELLAGAGDDGDDFLQGLLGVTGEGTDEQEEEG
jgi:hypothetical protein